MVCESAVLVSVPARVFAEMADEIDRLGEAVARLRIQLSSLLGDVDGTETSMGANSDAEPEVISGVDLEPLARVSLHADVAEEDGLLAEAVFESEPVVDEVTEQFSLHDDFIAAMSADEVERILAVGANEAAAEVKCSAGAETAVAVTDVDAEDSGTGVVDAPVVACVATEPTAQGVSGLDTESVSMGDADGPAVAAGEAETTAAITEPEVPGQAADEPVGPGDVDTVWLAKPEEASVIVISNPVLDLKAAQPVDLVNVAGDETVTSDVVAPVAVAKVRSRRRGRWVGVFGLLLLAAASGTAVLLGVPELALAELASALS